MVTALVKRTDTAVGIAASLFLVLGSRAGVLPFGLTEVAGFLSGGVSVWLLVKESVWNWAWSIANTLIYLVIFLDARLFADSGLQLFFTAAALWGWWYWLHGGDHRRERSIGRVGFAEAATLAALVAIATYAMTLYLRSVDDTAPFLDALTTAGSLGAFYLQCRKLIENWLVWIALDLIYIPLYVVKNLPLTALLYAVFMAMCCKGLLEWHGKLKAQRHWHRGAVVGKFYPFHTGHRHLIKTASAHADHVTVIVCSKHDQLIPAETRARWIRQTHPNVTVIVYDQAAAGLDDDDTAGWARATKEVLGVTPDVVFTSERYGRSWARALGCDHYEVDRRRRTERVSGTMIRRDPIRNFGYLTAAARAHYVKRVCVIGAESTGKSTLSAALAEHYDTIWVPEYGRAYTEVGRDPGAPWTTDEFRHIARTQNWLEDFLAGQANRVLICDTNAFVTATFHEAYLGDRDAVTEEIAAQRTYDLYLLCDVDAPFEQDETGLRDERLRDPMQLSYMRHLDELGAEYVIVRGSHEERVAHAVAAIDLLLRPRMAAVA